MTSKFDGRAIVRERNARYLVEVLTTHSAFRSPREWVEALDETLADLARSYGKEPSVTVAGVLEDMAS